MSTENRTEEKETEIETGNRTEEKETEIETGNRPEEKEAEIEAEKQTGQEAEKENGEKTEQEAKQETEKKELSEDNSAEENHDVGNIKDPGAAWAAENAKATGADFEENMKSAGIPGHIVMILAACLVILLCVLIFLKGKSGEKTPAEETQSSAAGTLEEAAEEKTDSAAGETAEAAGSGKTGGQSGISGEGETAKEAEQAQTAGTGGTSAAGTAAVRSQEMDALENRLREEIAEKNGDWSVYLYRIDTGEEIGVNANDPMISASLIKLFIAGCYFEQVEAGNISDDYQSQLYAMLSASDNGSANQLIDLLGMDQINLFIQEHDYKAGQLNRKMLENNGTENYTSSRDCGDVLRSVYEGTYVSKEASERILEALREQIERNRNKIPAGVPGEVDTANKTGELLTVNSEGVNVFVQNDAAIIFAENHPYILVVMSASSNAGEGQLHQEIAGISEEVYRAVCEEQAAEE